MNPSIGAISKWKYLLIKCAMYMSIELKNYACVMCNGQTKGLVGTTIQWSNWAKNEYIICVAVSSLGISLGT